MKQPVYTFRDGTTLTVDEMKEINMYFYQRITQHRYLLKDIDPGQTDIRHIFRTLLESNSTYFVVGNDRGNMDSTLVFSKVDLVKILKAYSLSYGIAYTDYEDYLLALVLCFNTPIPEFGQSDEVEIYVSYDDLAKLVEGIRMDDTMLDNWRNIQNYWEQKEKFKDLD